MILNKKINKKGFYCSSDSVYFNTWTKLFIASTKKHAPWAHIHVHVFDAVDEDIVWCQQNGVSITTEITSPEYSESLELKKDFWVNMRFVRIPEIYDDSTPLVAVDSDSLFKNDLSEEEFDRDMQHSWVTTRQMKKLDYITSLGSGVGFGNDPARHILRTKLLENSKQLRWWLDQTILDAMLISDEINAMDLRYNDFTYNPTSYIWSGKGKRKFEENFHTLANYYRI
jgi:hypothetical protein